MCCVEGWLTSSTLHAGDAPYTCLVALKRSLRQTVCSNILQNTLQFPNRRRECHGAQKGGSRSSRFNGANVFEFNGFLEKGDILKSRKDVHENKRPFTLFHGDFTQFHGDFTLFTLVAPCTAILPLPKIFAILLENLRCSRAVRFPEVTTGLRPFI